MTVVAFVVALLACGLIMLVGGRFLLRPRVATAGYGIQENDVRALTSIKGVRDITSGVVPLVALAAAGQQAFGWALVAAAITPVGDAIIVLTTGGKAAYALGIHGLTAALLVAAGLLLALG